MRFEIGRFQILFLLLAVIGLDNFPQVEKVAVERHGFGEADGIGNSDRIVEPAAIRRRGESFDQSGLFVSAGARQLINHNS